METPLPKCEKNVPYSLEVLSAEREILKMVARGQSVGKILDVAVTTVEKLLPGILCSVLMIDQEEKRVFLKAAPGLPKEFINSVDEIVLCCPFDSYATKESQVATVNRENIEIDSLWAKCQKLAQAHGLSGSLFVPICDTNGLILGAFTLYDHKGHSLSHHDIEMVEALTHLIGIATERDNMGWTKAGNETEKRVQSDLTHLESLNHQLSLEVKKLEEDLEETKKSFRSLLQTAGCAIILLSRNCRILEFNGEAERIYGCKKDEVLGKNYVELFFSQDKRDFEAKIIENILNGEPLRGFENSIRSHNGTEREMLWNATPWFDSEGKTIGCIGIGTDITKRKQIERALRESEKKLRHLSSELLNAQEKERRRISIELHDELGQSLTTLKLQLKAIEKKLRRELNELRGDWLEALRYLDQIIKNTRRLSHGLSPIILEDLGLSSTLRWLVEDFSRRCGIACSIDINEIDKFFMPESQIVIYRVFQECLTNIAKHAQATHVSVIVGYDERRKVSFYIEDDGVGFNVKEVSNKNTGEKGLGLTTVEERIKMLGGSLKVWSQAGLGTKITFILPMD